MDQISERTMMHFKTREYTSTFVNAATCIKQAFLRQTRRWKLIEASALFNNKGRMAQSHPALAA
jgi:hypothetical protein